MTLPDDDSNPFRAPESMSPDVETLADDAEFLFSSNEILCRDKVELPKVCIRLGETENLVRRQEALRMISGAGVLGVITSLIMFITLVTNFGARGILLLLVTVGVSTAIHQFALRSSLPLRHKVDATWYVSERYLWRVRWQNRIGRIVIIGFAGLVGWTIASGFETLTEIAGVMLSALTIGSVISVGLQTERKLALRGRRLAGRHRGLMVLTGHSRRFAQVAERINSGF